MILCSACYDSLHKYLIFVTSSLKLEQKVCNYYPELTANNKIQKLNVKLEELQEFINIIKKENESNDENTELSNEEINIKCDLEDEDNGEEIDKQ